MIDLQFVWTLVISKFYNRRFPVIKRDLCHDAHIEACGFNVSKQYLEMHII